jgi:tetratricopeptide (TPR) repeat protein
MFADGAPKQALAIYDRSLELMKRSQDKTPPPYMRGNRARALEALGRFQEARAGYLVEVSTGAQQHNIMAQVHGLAGLASIAQVQHDRAAAQYLKQATDLLTPIMPAGLPPWRALAIIQGRLDLDDRRFDAAREQFSSALGNAHTSLGIAALLGRSDAELLAGNAAAAAEDARLALDAARTLQGNLPYSNLTGLSLLAVGRAERQLGHNAQAQDAFRGAEQQLANTVDADHPALVEVRRTLSERRIEAGNAAGTV